MKTELQKIHEAIAARVTASPVVSYFIHYWTDEDGGCGEERPSNPRGECLKVSYYTPCDKEDLDAIDRVLRIIKTAMMESPVKDYIYQNYDNEDDGSEWIDGVFPRGRHATEWAIDYHDMYDSKQPTNQNIYGTTSNNIQKA